MNIKIKKQEVDVLDEKVSKTSVAKKSNTEKAPSKKVVVKKLPAAKKSAVIDTKKSAKAAASEKPKRKSKNYLNTADMLAELAKSNAQGKLTEEMGKMFVMLVRRYASVPRFSGYSYNDEMQGFAQMTLAKVWKSFNAEKYNNPFAYFTQVVHNAFHQLDNAERKQRDIRDAVRITQGLDPSFNYKDRIQGTSDNEDLLDDIDRKSVV